MTHKLKTDIVSSTYLRLISDLLESFPLKTDLDYFDLCQADPFCTTLTDSTRLAFDSVSAFIRILLDAELAKADHFTDGTTTFFWNVYFTPKGYERASGLSKAMHHDDHIDSGGLILYLCSKQDTEFKHFIGDEVK